MTEKNPGEGGGLYIDYSDCAAANIAMNPTLSPFTSKRWLDSLYITTYHISTITSTHHHRLDYRMRKQSRLFCGSEKGKSLSGAPWRI